MLEISPIPAFHDNYIWLLREPGNTACAVVDPGDADPVLDRLRADGLTLSAILITHRHGDHTGGVRELKTRFPAAVVFGPAREPIPALDRPLREGDTLDVPGLTARFSVMDVPGHTEGHIAYYGEGVLFCGDTLFAGGCGRVFSGTFEQLHDALARIAALPAETRVYCAHEYTAANLGFAEWVEPDNPQLHERVEATRAARARDEPTVPSRLAEERATNPFLRTTEPAVIAAAERWAGQRLADSRAVFRALRTWKDRDYD